MLYLSEWEIVVFGGGAAGEHAIYDKKKLKVTSCSNHTVFNEC